MLLKNFQLLFYPALFFICNSGSAQINKNNLAITSKVLANSFTLFSSSVTPTFYYDSKDAKVVQIAAEAFTNDINLISGKQIKLNTSNIIAGEYAIIAGTIGQSKIIDELIKNKWVDVSEIKDKWERFTIQIIKGNNNAKSAGLSANWRSGGALVIAGSDRRGTAFGIFHLSRMMGISPLVWWADVLPEKKQQLFISGIYISAAPSVQYRGIFINDEDWGLQPWAAKNMDTAIKDIGPKTYAKVFELLLRLKANYIWPAMHPCTKAFYYYKDNPKVADDYAIVVGGSHCEPMLRNNVCEWAETYEEEYKKKPGEWRYDVNKDEIYKYWDDRIKESVNYESVFTVGMRGVHDGSMPGPKDPNEKVKLLEKVITDQREILQNNFKRSSAVIPQIFVPYKEVLSLYRRGMKLADDVTIIWPDDNHGYIRQLPNEEEQKRSGGHGVYYHLSYWGSPADYLWLSTISPALIGYEMKKAYDYGAKKLWVFNIGDIKPAELEMQFALDMAWDIKTYDANYPERYIHQWATASFGSKAAKEITDIKMQYYKLAQNGKPEHLAAFNFSNKQTSERLAQYKQLKNAAVQTSAAIPSLLQDAYYQLVLYPVKGAAWMNEKIAYDKMAKFAFAGNGGSEAKNFIAIAIDAYDSIKQSTNYYNTVIAAGKWNGIMSYHPRDQKVFNPPTGFDSLKIKSDSIQVKKETGQASLLQTITAKQLYERHLTENCTLLPSVGISDASLVANNNAQTAVINYISDLPAGKYKVVLKCLPTYAMEKEKQLNYTIAFNNETAQNANVHAETETAAWKENVIRGYSEAVTYHTVNTGEHCSIKITLKNKNLVVNQIEIYKAQ